MSAVNIKKKTTLHRAHLMEKGTEKLIHELPLFSTATNQHSVHQHPAEPRHEMGERNESGACCLHLSHITFPAALLGPVPGSSGRQQLSSSIPHSRAQNRPPSCWCEPAALCTALVWHKMKDEV